MKKALSITIAAALTLLLCACGGGGSSSEPGSASSGGNVSVPVEPPKDDTAYEITYQSVKPFVNSIGTQYAQVIVEIENTGTSPLYLSSGTYDLETADGFLVTSNSMVSTYPQVIAPGEKGYMYEEDMLDERVDGELTVKPRPDIEKATIEDIRYTVTDVEISPDKYNGLKVKGRVENQTEEDAPGMVYVVFILKDAAGVPIGQVFTIVDELPAGDKVGFEASGLSLPDDVTADTVASYDVYSYPSQFQW